MAPVTHAGGRLLKALVATMAGARVCTTATINTALATPAGLAKSATSAPPHRRLDVLRTPTQNPAESARVIPDTKSTRQATGAQRNSRTRGGSYRAAPPMPTPIVMAGAPATQATRLTSSVMDAPSQRCPRSALCTRIRRATVSAHAARDTRSMPGTTAASPRSHRRHLRGTRVPRRQRELACSWPHAVGAFPAITTHSVSRSRIDRPTAAKDGKVAEDTKLGHPNTRY